MLMFVNKSLRSSVIALLRLDKLYSSGIAPKDATLRFAHEIENHVALLASGNFALYHTNGFGDCVAAVVEYAVYFLDEFDSLGAETATAQAHGIHSGIANRFAGSLDKGRNVLVDKGSALHHDMRSDVAELVNQAATTNDSEVVDFHFTGKLACIADNNVVADDTIVSDVAVGHNETVAAYYCAALSRSTAVYGHTFAQYGVVADDSSCLLALEFQILGNGTDDRAGENGNPCADTSAFENCDIAANACTRADFDVAVNCGEWTDNHVVGNLSFGIDAC